MKTSKLKKFKNKMRNTEKRVTRCRILKRRFLIKNVFMSKFKMKVTDQNIQKITNSLLEKKKKIRNININLLDNRIVFQNYDS